MNRSITLFIFLLVILIEVYLYLFGFDLFYDRSKMEFGTAYYVNEYNKKLLFTIATTIVVGAIAIFATPKKK